MRLERRRIGCGDRGNGGGGRGGGGGGGSEESGGLNGGGDSGGGGCRDWFQIIIHRKALTRKKFV